LKEPNPACTSPAREQAKNASQQANLVFDIASGVCEHHWPMKPVAIDLQTFGPVGRLVSGPLENVSDLLRIEEFVRAAVMHDGIYLHLLPGYGWQQEAGFIDLLDEMGPDSLLARKDDAYLMPDEPLAISPALTKFASEYAGRVLETPDIGQALTDYEQAHLAETYTGYIEQVVWTLRNGGSTLLNSDFGAKLFAQAEQYPDSLFRGIDQSWNEYAQLAQSDGLEVTVPPLLGVVLTRCARRDAIPSVIRELRDEWACARKKVWSLLDALRVCQTLSEAVEIRKELTDASRLFSPTSTELDSRPVRILWEIVAAGAAGAGVAALSGGRPVIGAVTGAVTQCARNVPAFTHEFGDMLFGRGAFDLARKVRRAVSQVECDALPRLLTDAERRKLGFK
jgi:hypothetical protein